MIPTIQVGIMAEPAIKFSLQGNYTCTQTGKKLQGDFSCSFQDGKIEFEKQLLNELDFVPENADCCFCLHNVTIGINFHWERKENQNFRGTLRFIIEEEKVRAINSINVEGYLESVISSEMSATSSSELLKAHAVISRSWLMKPIVENDGLLQHKQHAASNLTTNSDTIIKWYERDAHTHFDVCADDHCQRYQGITRATTQAVKQAVTATCGEVLTYNGHICDARFSKSCGGISELFENCWDDEHYNYLTPIRDAENELLPDLTNETEADLWIRTAPKAFCNTSDKEILSQVLNNYDRETTDFYRWQVHYTQAELSELVKKRSGIDFGTITDMQPIERGASGRLIKLKITGTKRSVIVGKELEIRKWLSESHLYSSAFVVDKDAAGNFTLTGAGWGHGVGLCQIGAAVMAAKGYNYKQILQHYFSDSTIENLW